MIEEQAHELAMNAARNKLKSHYVIPQTPQCYQAEEVKSILTTSLSTMDGSSSSLISLTQVLRNMKLLKMIFPKSLTITEIQFRKRLLTELTFITKEYIIFEYVLEIIKSDFTLQRLTSHYMSFYKIPLTYPKDQKNQKLNANSTFHQKENSYQTGKQLTKQKMQIMVKYKQSDSRASRSVKNSLQQDMLTKSISVLNVQSQNIELKGNDHLYSSVAKLECNKIVLMEKNKNMELKGTELLSYFLRKRPYRPISLVSYCQEVGKIVRQGPELQGVWNHMKLVIEKMDISGTKLSPKTKQLCSLESYQKYIVSSREYNRKTISNFERMRQLYRSDLKQLENKLYNALEEVVKQKDLAEKWKNEFQKLNVATYVLQLYLQDEHSCCLPQSKQKNLVGGFQIMVDKLEREKNARMRASVEKDLVKHDYHILEQNITSLKTELALKNEKLSSLVHQLRASSPKCITGKCSQMRKPIVHVQGKDEYRKNEQGELLNRLKNLEQTKERLEVNAKRIHEDYKRQLQEKEEEMKVFKNNILRNVKTLESELECEQNKRSVLLREKKELQKQLEDSEERLYMNEFSSHNDIERLKKDLKRSSVLLQDAHIANECSREGPNKAVVLHLRNQLEDAECACTAAVKGRLAAEMESIEAVFAMDEAIRARTNLEARLSAAAHDLSKIQKQADENEEELSQVLKKYKASVDQISVEKAIQQEQADQVAELEKERASLHEQLGELASKLESKEILCDSLSSHTVKMLRIKNKELSAKLDFEQTARTRLEIQVSHLTEKTQKLEREISLSQMNENSFQESVRKANKNLRSCNEERQILMRKEVDYNARCQELERRIEISEAEKIILKDDLRLAMKRINNLQCALECEINNGIDCMSGKDVTSNNEKDLANYLGDVNRFCGYDQHV